MQESVQEIPLHLFWMTDTFLAPKDEEISFTSLSQLVWTKLGSWREIIGWTVSVASAARGPPMSSIFNQLLEIRIGAMRWKIDGWAVHSWRGDLWPCRNFLHRVSKNSRAVWKEWDILCWRSGHALCCWQKRSIFHLLCELLCSDPITLWLWLYYSILFIFPYYSFIFIQRFRFYFLKADHFKKDISYWIPKKNILIF